MTPRAPALIILGDTACMKQALSFLLAIFAPLGSLVRLFEPVLAWLADFDKTLNDPEYFADLRECASGRRVVEGGIAFGEYFANMLVACRTVEMLGLSWQRVKITTDKSGWEPAKARSWECLMARYRRMRLAFTHIERDARRRAARLRREIAADLRGLCPRAPHADLCRATPCALLCALLCAMVGRIFARTLAPPARGPPRVPVLSIPRSCLAGSPARPRAYAQPFSCWDVYCPTQTLKKGSDIMARQQDVDYTANHPIHDAVFGDEFGRDPDGYYNDTPRGAISENVNSIGIAAQPERNQPMRNLGDTDQGDRQPLGGRRQ